MADLYLEKSLKKIDYTFRWTGMNLESDKKTRSQNMKYRLLYCLNFFLMNTDLIGEIWWFVDGAKKGVNFTILTYSAPCIAYCLLGDVKSLYMLINDVQINKIVAMLRQMELAHKNHEKNSKKEDIVKKEVDFLFLILKALGVFNWALLVSFPLMPLCLTALEYYNTKEIHLKLPFQVMYPFDETDIRVWPFAYLRQVWGTVLTILEINGVDYFFFVSITFMVIQFKLLQHDLETLFDKQKTFQDLNHDPEFRRKFIRIIRWHQELLHSVDLLETIYSKSTLFNFVCSSLLICLSLFNVMTIDDKPIILSFSAFLFASLLQIFSLCYFGDKLMQSSTEVTDAVYRSKWYLVNESTKKDLKIIQIRGQEPCKVTAYGFADVNLGAFSAILSTSWSYFALLRTVYSPSSNN